MRPGDQGREGDANVWLGQWYPEMPSLSIHSHLKSNKSGFLFCQEASDFFCFLIGFHQALLWSSSAPSHLHHYHLSHPFLSLKTPSLGGQFQSYSPRHFPGHSHSLLQGTSHPHFSLALLKGFPVLLAFLHKSPAAITRL